MIIKTIIKYIYLFFLTLSTIFFLSYQIILFVLLGINSGLWWRLALLSLWHKGPNTERKTALGRAMVIFFTRSGPGFIKLGQLLAARDDMLGPELCAELSLLRDKVPADLSPRMYKALCRELGAAQTQFTIESKPVASASVAQVYRARNAQGEEFALKLLRPKAALEYKHNIRLLRVLCKVADALSPQLKGLRLPDLVKIIAEASRVELDMRLEAAAANKIGESLHKTRLGVYVPRIFWTYTTKQLLVMEWIEGIPLHKVKKDPLNPYKSRKIAKKLVISFFHQVYVDGFFHADLHSGNVFIDSYNRLVLLDFGLVSALNEHDKRTMAEIFYHFLAKNYDKVAEIHHKVGYIPKNANIQLFALACRSIAEPIVGQNSGNIQMSTLLQRLFAMAIDFEMETQPQLLLLQKNLLALESTLNSLDNSLNLWEIAQPWLEKWYQHEFSLSRRVSGAVGDLGELYTALKGRFTKIT